MFGTVKQIHVLFIRTSFANPPHECRISFAISPNTFLLLNPLWCRLPINLITLVRQRREARSRLRAYKDNSSSLWKAHRKAPATRALTLRVACITCVNGWTNEWINYWLNNWINDWLDGWMDGWMNGWMDGCLHVCLHARNHTCTFVHVCPLISTCTWHVYMRIDAYTHSMRMVRVALLLFSKRNGFWVLFSFIVLVLVPLITPRAINPERSPWPIRPIGDFP